LIPPDGPGPLWVMWAPTAARVGYSPSSILSNLTTQVNNQAEPNLYVNINGGGIENEELVPATISEMLMQSFQGNIILFPNWPAGTNAHFGDNLAYGNFLVSSAIENNAVLYARIISQAGQTVSITNPWPGQPAQFYRNGTNEGTLSGTIFSIPTSTNDVILLGPSGTSDATITSELGESLAVLSGLPSNGGPGKVLPYNVNAIYTNGSAFSSTSGADGQGNAFSATLLGAAQAFNGTTFTYGPANAPDAFNNVTVALTPGSFSSLNILAYAINGGQASQTFQVNYTNGTFSTATQSISDWGIPQGYPGETKEVTMAYRNTSTGGETTFTSYVYGYTIPVTPGLTVESITLPANGNVIVLGIQDEATSAGEGPFGGSPAGIPGTVLMENYDTGGQGVGYSVTSINGTDNGYRSDGIDLETASSPATRNDLGWTGTGQWFRYTVNVAAAGTYNVTFEVASPSGVTDGFHIANSSGTNLSGSVNIPATSGWQTWTTVTASVTLPAGQQVLTLNEDNGGWNIDTVAFTATSLPYSINAIYTNGATFSDGVDGGGHALSATLLGATQAFNGTTFTYGLPNAVDAFNNVSIPLSAGSFSSLNVLALAVNGNQPSQTFTVHYTNGTTSTATQSISDWCSPQNYSGETTVVTMAYRNTNTGGELTMPTCYVYGYIIPVTSGLTVSSLSIPANGNVIVLGVQDQQ
jgi:hypothetical protein